MSNGKKKGYAPGLGEFTYSEEYVDLKKEVHLDKFGNRITDETVAQKIAIADKYFQELYEKENRLTK
jgi:hypothetical protein